MSEWRPQTSGSKTHAGGENGGGVFRGDAPMEKRGTGLGAHASDLDAIGDAQRCADYDVAGEVGPIINAAVSDHAGQGIGPPTAVFVPVNLSHGESGKAVFRRHAPGPTGII